MSILWFEFSIFFLLDWLPYQALRVQSVLLFSHDRTKERCIHGFLEEQTTLSKIWTRAAESVSFDDKRYAMSASYILHCISQTLYRISPNLIFTLVILGTSVNEI